MVGSKDEDLNPQSVLSPSKSNLNSIAISSQPELNARAKAAVQETLDTYVYISDHLRSVHSSTSTSTPTPPPTSTSTSTSTSASSSASPPPLPSYENLFDHAVMTSFRLVSARCHPPSFAEVVWELPITQTYANLNGVMHGGAAGVIFDMATTMALCPLQRPGYWDFMGGVTRSLNISYLRAVPVGVTVRIRAWVVQIGRTMALLRGVMEEEEEEEGEGEGEKEEEEGKRGEKGDGRGRGKRYKRKRGIVYATCEHHKVNVPTKEEHLKLREQMREERRTRGSSKDGQKGERERKGKGKPRL